MNHASLPFVFAAEGRAVFIDARQLESGATVECDICIVGGGAAGIALARELPGERRNVVLLESGGFEFDGDTQKLAAGKVAGRPTTALDADRLRFLGGTTNHWQGACRPFDPIDFEARAEMPGSGWPVSRDELEPYYRRAHAICELGPYTYEPAAWIGRGPPPFDFGTGARMRTILFQNSPPTRFGTAYRDELARAVQLFVYLNANVVDIATTEDAREVTGLRVACLKGPTFRVRARHYILAAGGIENARLLLNARSVEKNGLGNENDLVGRFFMDHPGIFKTAKILFTEPYENFAFYDHRSAKGIKIYAGFAATEEVLRREHLPNFHFLIDRDEPTSVVSLRSVYRSVKTGRTPDRLGFHLGRIIGDLDGIARVIYRRALGRDPPLYSTFYMSECLPDPASRVTLTSETDALGLHRVQLDWRLPADFEATMRRAHEIFGEELGRAGLGRLRLNTAATTHDPMTEIENMHHHMGTTRMHADPKHGVVDANCRIHGKANLFIAGSSIFPTYSHDGPTLTLLALALRLADHLKSLG
jgi:choline dehydrogenase-like flavoprotein